MGEKRVDAGLRLRRIENKLSLAVFLLDGVVVRDCDLSEGLAVTGNAITKQSVVSAVNQTREHHGK